MTPSLMVLVCVGLGESVLVLVSLLEAVFETMHPPTICQ